jgi:predicted RNA-binding Zn ribbon-like protein
MIEPSSIPGVRHVIDQRKAGQGVRLPGVDCGSLFLDPRGRRRWCDMAACGNRATVTPARPPTQVSVAQPPGTH